MFLHLITLCMGLLIAAGLQQTFEYFQRRRRTRALLAAHLDRQASEEKLPPAPTSEPPTTP